LEVSVTVHGEGVPG